MAAPPEISDLVARFADQLEAYESGRYNETQLRREFVDPMFKICQKSANDIAITFRREALCSLFKSR